MAVGDGEDGCDSVFLDSEDECGGRGGGVCGGFGAVADGSAGGSGGAVDGSIGGFGDTDDG